MFSSLEEALLLLCCKASMENLKKKKNYWDKVRGEHDLKDFL